MAVQLGKEISINLSRHAKRDRIPLRFGFVPTAPTGTFVPCFQEKTRKDSSGQKYRGHLTLQVGEQEKKIKNVRVILGINAERTYSIITVLPKRDMRIDESAKNKISELLGDNKICSPFIASHLHKAFIKGKLSNLSDLARILERNDIEVGSSELSEWCLEGEESERIKREAVENEKKLIASTGASARADVSPICTLMGVFRGTCQHPKNDDKWEKCTFLQFDNGTPERKMFEWADPDGDITRKARSLIGKLVVTTVWHPEEYSPLEWFRNIEEAK